jgi:hypothetical protein
MGGSATACGVGPYIAPVPAPTARAGTWRPWRYYWGGAVHYGGKVGTRVQSAACFLRDL